MGGILKQTRRRWLLLSEQIILERGSFDFHLLLRDQVIFRLVFVDVDNLLLVALLLLLNDFGGTVHVEDDAEPSQRRQQQNFDQEGPVPP